MTGRGGSDQELDGEQMALIIVGAIGLSVVVARHRSFLAGIRGWLVDRKIVVDGPAVLHVPQIGGLDLGRHLIGAGILVIMAVACRMIRRVRAGRSDRQ